MKKILTIVAVLILFSFTLPNDKDKDDLIMRLQVMKVTLEADMEAGYIDSTYANSYLHNVKQCLIILGDETNKTAKLVK